MVQQLREAFSFDEAGGRSRYLVFGRDTIFSAEVIAAVAEVARRLGVSTATVYKVCAAGRLGHVRVSNAIRVPETALADYPDPRDPPQAPGLALAQN